MPRITTYSNARANLKSICDEVAEGGEPIIIKRRSGGDVALVSLDELVGLEETAHLLRSPENARRLFESLAELASDGGESLAREEFLARFSPDG